jgi:DNA gyrase subunit A
VKKTATSQFSNAKTRGIIAIKLDSGDKLVSGILTGGEEDIMLITRRGQALRMEESSVRSMGRSSHGVRGIRLNNGDELASALGVEKDKSIFMITEQGAGKRIDFDKFHPHGRGTGGQKIFGNVDKKGEIIGALAVADTDELVCMTSQGKTLRLEVSSVNKQSSSGSSGVSVLNINSPDFVIGIDRVACENEDEN